MPPSECTDLEKRDRLRVNLAAVLGLADDESFLCMLWAVNAIHTGHADSGRNLFRAVPDAAITDDMMSPQAIRPWELETLANELLGSPKDAFYRILDCRAWLTVVETVNLLRDLEDAEYVARDGAVPILRELYRIGGRQFDWQRGFFNVPQFYRNAFIYGQGACAEYFEGAHGVTVDQMTLVGFGLMAAFLDSPRYERAGNLAIIGITPEQRERVLKRICAPIGNVRSVAAQQRAIETVTAYRPSVLRQYPCIAFGPHGSRLRAPLPELIAWRVTSGLFYDVIGGGGAVRADYGRRFEDYARRFMAAMLPELRLMEEWRYRIARQPVASPDIIVLTPDTEEIAIAIECKAARMSYAARFADQAIREPGYEEMAKAAFQLWRFFSHCRRGLVGRALASDGLGIVLTLDSWLVLGQPLRDEVMARATEIAALRDPQITVADRRPIVFCSITDLENTLATATTHSFLAAVARAADDERAGWLLSSVHDELRGGNVDRKPYPFEEDMKRLLPWWGLWRNKRRRAGSGAG